jgi:hypothetical protein
VLKGLKYADITLRNTQRKLCPAGTRALQTYKDSCISLLKLLDVEEGEIFETPHEERKQVEECHRVFIREAEKSMQINACMRATGTASEQTLQENILELQRTAFYAKYGDYFSEICNELKEQAQKGNLAGWQKLSGKYWTDIAKQVDIEEPIYKRFLKWETGLHAEMPTTYAITTTCYRIGLHPHDTLEIVKQYGIRNDLLHANLIPMIKGGLFADLARRLCLDYCDIPLLVPAADKADSRVLETLLMSMIDLWFERPESDPQNYQRWKFTKQLEDYCERLNEKTPLKSEADLNKEILMAITKAYKKNLRDSTNHDEMVKLFSEITGKMLPPKRVASAQLEAEINECKIKKRKWDALVNLTSNAKEMYDSYFLTYGEVGAPGEIVEEKSLE